MTYYVMEREYAGRTIYTVCKNGVLGQNPSRYERRADAEKRAAFLTEMDRQTFGATA